MIVPDEYSCQCSGREGLSGREGSDPRQIGPLAVSRRSRRFNELTLSLRTTPPPRIRTAAGSGWA